MRTYILRQLDRVGRRVTSGLLRRSGDGFDLLEVAQLRAAFDSASYYERHMLTARACTNDLELLSSAIELADKDGLFLEFGVASGRTISHIASRHSGPVHGFDSFLGLPENWRTGYEKGTFAGVMPEVPPNVHFEVGLFSNTLPDFVTKHSGSVSFVHIDCDLYSSTKMILDTLAGRFYPGTVLVFDEYFNYPGWRAHEFKAFQEFVSESHIKYDYIYFVPRHQQVCVIIR